MWHSVDIALKFTRIDLKSLREEKRRKSDF